MNIINIIILAVIQGITEFLPVSSSAHLILAERWLGIEGEGGNAVIIAVHFGSLFAVMIYFRHEVKRLFSGAWDILRLKFHTSDAQLLLKLAVATIPVVALGLLLKMSGLIDLVTTPVVIGLAMIIFGLVLWYFDKTCATTREFDDFNFRDAIIMGLWQAVALIPGTSRSGATVTASRILKFKRADGAKIAMLMSIPTILAASLLTSVDIVRAGQVATLGKTALIAAFFSFIAAFFALSLMMRFLQTTSYLPYVIYRLLLGAAILLVYL